jgi:hypothetical protein
LIQIEEISCDIAKLGCGPELSLTVMVRETIMAVTSNLGSLFSVCYLFFTQVEELEKYEEMRLLEVIDDEVGDNEENPIKTIALPTVGKIIWVPIKNSVVVNKWDNMKQFKSRKTIGLARRMLLYKSFQLVVLTKRHNGEELLVKVQDQFMYTGENTMGDMREP